MTNAASVAIPSEFLDCLALQQQAFNANRYPDYQQRLADLKAIQRLLTENQDALIEAVDRDYGCRSRHETIIAELISLQEGLHGTMKQLKKWMKVQRRAVDFLMYPFARARVIPQPLGVIGVVVPWNFPISLALGPVIGALVAGNRVMVKMSENSNHLAHLLMAISSKYLPEDKLKFFEDGGGRGPAFTSLAFDHLFFTGSPTTGKAVMANCAQNLTPVTLELGGKSPAIVANDFPIQTAAERILWAKMFNAGQICINVDYLFLPEGQTESFVESAKQIAKQRYPDINNGDYTAIIDQRSYDRLQNALEEARNKGALVINLFEGQQPNTEKRIMPLHLVLNVTDDMELMQREIFGPILPIKIYQHADEVVQYINERPRPLALYVYTNDQGLADWYIKNTLSGGVTINDSLLHAEQHNMPFGGIGNSGMGHHHGYEGFATFSKLRPVFYQGPIRLTNLTAPPYAGKPSKILDFILKMKSG